MPAARPAQPTDKLRDAVGRYYTGKLRAHGPTPAGADWSSAASQHLRFAQLLRICGAGRSAFSLNDFGCGYGALVPHLAAAFPRADYLGIDVSQAMVEAARRLHPGAAFTVGHASPREADYTVASGVFNVKLRAAQARWKAYTQDTLAQLFATSRRGLAVNFLAPRPAHLSGTHALYRPWPQEWIAFCEDALGAPTELLADYGLGEYTLLVRRNR